MSVGAFTTVRVAVALVRLSPVVVLWMATLKVLPLSSMAAGGVVCEAAVAPGIEYHLGPLVR